VFLAVFNFSSVNLSVFRCEGSLSCDFAKGHCAFEHISVWICDSSDLVVSLIIVPFAFVDCAVGVHLSSVAGFIVLLEPTFEYVSILVLHLALLCFHGVHFKFTDIDISFGIFLVSLSVSDSFLPLAIVPRAVCLEENSIALLSGILEVPDVHISVWVDDSSETFLLSLVPPALVHLPTFVDQTALSVFLLAAPSALIHIAIICMHGVSFLERSCIIRLVAVIVKRAELLVLFLDYRGKASKNGIR